MKVVKNESKTLWILKIEDDLFTYETPLGMTFNEFNRLSGMDDDLFDNEMGILGISYPPHVEQQCDDPEYYNDLDIYESRICYDKNEKIYVEASNEYMEIKKQWMTHGIDTDMKYDPSDVDFAEWIALNFSNHSTMDWYTKNTLWMYWIRGDDEEVLTDKELSDLEETHDKDIPWVPEEPWSENRAPYEIIDHFCVPFHEDDELKDEALMKKAEFEESRDPCSFDVDDLDDHLVSNNARDYANKEEEQYKERGCELLRNPHMILPTCKIERFKVIKYSFGLEEEFFAIKKCGYDDWIRTEDDACHAYRDTFINLISLVYKEI
ncbi:hypothetical protein Tco_0558496 [Tanacetum coccineum]